VPGLAIAQVLFRGDRLVETGYVERVEAFMFNGNGHAFATADGVRVS
jgi:hypothetical protein